MIKYLKLSGLEPLIIDKTINFINIGERTNVAGSQKFLKLIQEEKYNDALQIARNQIEDGAQIIDINMDNALIDGKKCMCKFLNLIASEPEIAKVPIMIDSSKWEIIEASLKLIQGKSIVNSISLKNGEKEFIKQAKIIKKYGAATIVMAFDEVGQADTFERKIEICERAYNILTKKVNFNSQDIIFDPNVFPVATGMEEHRKYGIDFIKATKWITENLPNVNVSGGISNISFSFRGNNTVREAMHSVFLYYAKKAGMKMAIVNPTMLEIYDNIPKELLKKVEAVILNTHKNATEELIEYAENNNIKIKKKVKKDEWRKLKFDERIKFSLVKGIDFYITTDIKEAINNYENPVDIIDKILMNAMNYVGKLFGEGKMFLPQVIKSARVMKKAVAYIQPFIKKKNNNKRNFAGKILLATVKGDVHDIGKNIVAIVLACNNFEIIDLGVMVFPEKIIETAIKKNVDIIGLSGLITPSLDEMVTVAEQMEKNNLKIPLIIGGATTSKAHTALKIAPIYSQLVVHAGDASVSVGLINNLLNKTNRKNFIEKKKNENIIITEKLKKKNAKKEFFSLEQARKNKFIFNLSKYQPIKPSFIGNKTINQLAFNELIKKINWQLFLKSYKLKQDSNNKKESYEIENIIFDANKLLKKIANLINIKIVFGFYNAKAVDEDIELYENGCFKSKLFSLRQQQINKEHNFSLADFIAPKNLNIDDYICLFAVNAETGTKELLKQFEIKNDTYSAIMLKLLTSRLAEASVEWLQEKIITDYCKGISEKIIRPAVGYSSYPDHSEKQTIFNILNAEKEINIKLTENYAIKPASSITGLFIFNPQAKYFAVGKITNEQLKNYSNRKNIDIELVKKHLAFVIQ